MLLKIENHLIWDACPFPPGFEPPRKESVFSAIANGLSNNPLFNYDRWHLVFFFIVFYIFMNVLLYDSPFVLWMFTPHFLFGGYLSLTSDSKRIRPRIQPREI
jgi:hypothetical protein